MSRSRSRSHPVLACFVLLLACGAGACFDTHLPPRTDAAGIDPSRSDPSDPAPACGAICEDHLGAMCASATEGLCTCDPRGNSGKGKWDCVKDWANRAVACAPGADHGTPCPRAIASIDQVCAGPLNNQACYCSASLTWRCMVVGK